MGARWTEEEKQFVRDNYQKMTSKEMAEVLKRPKDAIDHVRRNENLKYDPCYPKKGDRLGRWELLTDRYVVEGKRQKEGMVLVRCDCGTEKEMPLSRLVTGDAQSCGCFHRERASELLKKRNTTHGMTHHPLFSVWSGMIGRCCRPSNIGFKDYGERGIKICDEWLQFQNFYDWATTHGWEPGLTIERENVNGDYEPSNCKFVTLKVNCNNKRNNRRITAFGETKTIMQWSEDLRCEVGYATLRDRLIKRGWSPEEAISTPSR